MTMCPAIGSLSQEVRSGANTERIAVGNYLNIINNNKFPPLPQITLTRHIYYMIQIIPMYVLLRPLCYMSTSHTTSHSVSARSVHNMQQLSLIHRGTYASCLGYSISLSPPTHP